jgi:hypothetical protein
VTGFLDPNTGTTTGSPNQDGAFKVPYAWQSSTLSYVPVLVDAAGNLLTAGGGGGGGGAVTIADGSDVAEGATTDAAVVTDANGTVSGKLRGLVKILASVWDSANGRLKVDASAVAVPVTGTFFQATQPVSATNLDVALSTRLKPADTLTGVTTLGSITNALPAGSNLLGKVGIDQTTPGTTNRVQTGSKTNNNGAPSSDNDGSLIIIANEAMPAYTEGNIGFAAADLRAALRTVGVPIAALGFYGWAGNTGGYAGLGANTPLFSMRWGDATRLMILLYFEISVFTTATATTAGITERQLIAARGFTASDTGGTAATLTGNNQKRRTSMGTSLLTDLRIGNPITAGTRTLDSSPIATAEGWAGLLSTGKTIGGAGGSPVGAARSTEGGGQGVALFNAINGQDHPQVFAQNEGIVLRIGIAEPGGATQQTFVDRVIWAEANKVY